jgi:predicted ArsR family transcriptional regulator
MDWACRSLVGTLDKDGGMSLSQLVERSGLARQTVHNHLKHLIQAGIVSQEAVKHGRGRPTMFYHKFKQPIEALEGTDIVALKFQKLKHACRFEKGGYCKEVKAKCVPEKCPLTIKTK